MDDLEIAFRMAEVGAQLASAKAAERTLMVNGLQLIAGTFIGLRIAGRQLRLMKQQNAIQQNQHDAELRYRARQDLLRELQAAPLPAALDDVVFKALQAVGEEYICLKGLRTDDVCDVIEEYLRPGPYFNSMRQFRSDLGQALWRTEEIKRQRVRDEEFDEAWRKTLFYNLVMLIKEPKEHGKALLKEKLNIDLDREGCQ